MVAFSQTIIEARCICFLVGIVVVTYGMLWSGAMASPINKCLLHTPSISATLKVARRQRLRGACGNRDCCTRAHAL